MGNKNVLLWVIAIVALTLSLLAVIGPKLTGVKSQAAVLHPTQNQSSILYQHPEGPNLPDPTCTYIGPDGRVYSGTIHNVPFDGLMCKGWDGKFYAIKDLV